VYRLLMLIMVYVIVNGDISWRSVLGGWSMAYELGQLGGHVW
jgi:hypothetical protein